MRLMRVGAGGPRIGPGPRQIAVYPEVDWSTSTVLVHLPGTESCPLCHADIVEETYTMQPFLRHGGYGAARRTVRRWCSALCGWSIVPTIQEERPERMTGCD